MSGALESIEPICARMCAARGDRADEVVPALRVAVDAQQAEFDDMTRYNANARVFHETLVDRCGSETMILVVGALETIWSAHEGSVRDERAAAGPAATAAPDSLLARRTRRAALRDHEKLLAAIEAGSGDRAFALASAHLAATRRSTLASGAHETINANLVGDAAPTPRQPGR